MTTTIFNFVTDLLNQRLEKVKVPGKSSEVALEGDGSVTSGVVSGNHAIQHEPEVVPFFTKLFTAAVHHAIADFTDSTGQDFNGEEHRTSAFMGYLGSCIGWYNLFSYLSNEEQLSIKWNTQRRSGTPNNPGEDSTGADFGVAIELADGFYNVAMFQAKNGSLRCGKPTFDINRPPAGYAKAPPKKDAQTEGGATLVAPPLAETDSQTDEDTKKIVSAEGHAANERLLSWISGKDIEPVERLGKKIKSPNERAKDAEPEQIDHQVIKMAQQNNFAFSSCGVISPLEKEPNWMHYVIWRNKDEGGGAPAVVGLDEVREKMGNKWESSKPEDRNNWLTSSGILNGLARLEYKVPGASSPGFAEFLISGLNEAAPGWLRVTEEQLKSIVKDFTDLGVNWSVAGRGSGSLICTVVASASKVEFAPDTVSGQIAEAAAPIVKAANSQNEPAVADTSVVDFKPKKLRK